MEDLKLIQEIRAELVSAGLKHIPSEAELQPGSFANKFFERYFFQDNHWIYFKVRGKKVPPGLVLNSEMHELCSELKTVKGIHVKTSFYVKRELDQFPLDSQNKRGESLYRGVFISFSDTEFLREVLLSIILWMRGKHKEALSVTARLGKKETKATTRVSQTTSRVGQDKFRSDLLLHWKGCAVTGITITDFLRASHIKPWKRSNSLERMDVYNGLLLVAHLDIAFDRGLISFNDDGSILVSKALNPAESMRLGIHEGLSIRKVAKQHIPYLAWHRTNVFI